MLADRGTDGVKSKLAHLEAMRGIAALVVVAAHMVSTFAPEGLYIWNREPWYVLINGPAAVAFFFVLSGYVLTLAPLRTGDTILIVRGVIKRWPRLAAPVLIAVLFSCILWHAGLFWHKEAAVITGSKALAMFPGEVSLSDQLPDMSFKAALAQGTWRTFFLGERYFLSPLWTMKFELFGSMVAFALAAALIAIRRRSLQVALLLSAAALLCYRNPIYIAFWLGVLLAWSRTISDFTIPKLFAIPAALASFYLLGFSPVIPGYRPPSDFYGWLPVQNFVYIHSLASAALLASVAFCPPLRQPLDGIIGRKLGQYSFPVYLLHVLIIMSLGMAVFMLTLPIGMTAAIIASVLSSIAGTIAASSALAYFEVRWVALVNRAADSIIDFFRLANARVKSVS
jgi:peptidoglycan/LPS O-acetylase OafA/YrhL